MVSRGDIMTFTYVCFIPVGTSGPISRASFWYTATAIHQHFECFKGSVSKLMWSFRVDAKIGRETFRSTKGEELGKTEVKPTVSASESGDHLTILLPKNWKTQLKEDLVLPDLGESISWKWWFWTLENTPQLRMTKDWTSLGGFTAKHRCPPKMFQTGMTCSSAVEAPGCAFSRKILVMASCFGEI